MQLLIGEYAFFVNESKLETFNKPETFQWNTENIPHSRISLKHWVSRFLPYPGH